MSNGTELEKKPVVNVNLVGSGSLPAHISAQRVRARIQVALALVVPLSERQTSDKEDARKLQVALSGLCALLRSEGYGDTPGD